MPCEPSVDEPSVAVVIGHHPDAPGAALRVGEHTAHEYGFWRPFARELVRSLQTVGITGHLVERPNAEPDADLADRVNALGADAAIELHFNAFKDPTANGTEMLHCADSAEGKRLARGLLQTVTRTLGTKNRGLKQKVGWPFLDLTEMPAVVCEPAFGSNRSDAWKLTKGQMDLLRAYRAGIAAYFEETTFS
jgi:N-acetylmuramoyl-L-alanine amidase